MLGFRKRNAVLTNPHTEIVPGAKACLCWSSQTNHLTKVSRANTGWNFAAFWYGNGCEVRIAPSKHPGPTLLRRTRTSHHAAHTALRDRAAAAAAVGKAEPPQQIRNNPRSSRQPAQTASSSMKGRAGPRTRSALNDIALRSKGERSAPLAFPFHSSQNALLPYAADCSRQPSPACIAAASWHTRIVSRPTSRRISSIRVATLHTSKRWPASCAHP